jgi:hypothetical protein
MKMFLQHGDRVRYKVGNRKMEGTVADTLPFHPQTCVPVLKRTKVIWMEREEVRKLPKRHEENNI